MVNVPLFAGNPQLQEQLRLQLPVFLQQVSVVPVPAAQLTSWGTVELGLQWSIFLLCTSHTDAESGVSLHPHQPTCHAGIAANPAGTANPADRGPRAGA